jgi:putative isomerase
MTTADAGTGPVWRHLSTVFLITMTDHQFSRREFLVLSAGAAAAHAFNAPLFAQTQSTASHELSREEVERMIRPAFECNDPELWRLTVDAYHQCVLGKLRPAEPPLKHPWLVPGGGYVGQWIWDTMFVADLLSYLPGQRENLRGVFQNYWDFQERWNSAKPEYAHGMIANFIAPNSGPKAFSGKTWQNFPMFSQAPLIAWGIEQIYRRTGDLELVRSGVGPLEAFHEWYWRERDIDDVGMVCVGSYDGVKQHARDETYDREVDLDDIKMVPHPGRPSGNNNGPWYGDILIPANTAYLLLSEQRLAQLAAEIGDRAMQSRREQRLAKGVAAMRTHMWDEKCGCFLALRRGTLEKIQPATVGGFVPLFSPVPAPEQAARMTESLRGPDWATPLPVPTVARTNKKYRSGGFWRGDVWPPTNFQVASGLAQHGYRELAAQIADTTIDNAIRFGISERYNSRTGAALGVHGLGMSALVITMALNGLSAKRKIRWLGNGNATPLANSRTLITTSSQS